MRHTETTPDDFEARLRRMRLAAPADDLYRRRLAAAVEPRRARFWSFRGWGFELALAAILLACLGLVAHLRSSSPAAQAAIADESPAVLRTLAEWSHELGIEHVGDQLARSRRLAEIEATHQLLQRRGLTPWM